MQAVIQKLTSIEARVSDSFADLSPEVWRQLLDLGDTNEVFLTYDWQRTWWDVFGRGRLLLITIERDGKPIAIAPLFADGGMVFFVGSGGSDYLDFVGNVSDANVFDEILATAIRHVPDFLGFRFYHVPDKSSTGGLLSAAAERLGLKCFDEGEMAAPFLDLKAVTPTASPADHKRLLKCERVVAAAGDLEIEHARTTEDIRPHLKEFFAQHLARWEASQFLEPQQREFYERLTLLADETGWLRFSRAVWQGRSIAFHFGFSYRGRYLYYKPSFAVELARYSPGQILLRHLFRAASDERVGIFDFGLGDEAFKSRFATGVNYVRTWGLYPRSICENEEISFEPASVSS